MPIPFAKYQALGNDYLVIDPVDLMAPLTAAQVRRLCDRHFGIGSDGILLGPSASGSARFALRIFNPDGSEAEKSGNGLRIFARYLRDRGLVGGEEFAIETPGGLVAATVAAGGGSVSVEMGHVSFWSDEIPVAGPRREVIDEQLVAGNRAFTICAATIGNPHCVVPLPEIGPELAREYGPLIETHPAFPRRTNVQFLKALPGGDAIQIEIWERGAGYTLASGSSSCAAAAVAHRLRLCGRVVDVHMPGGVLAVEIGEDFAMRMSGPVAKIAEGVLSDEVLSTPRAVARDQ
jgi:diaminopimelate epimerase